ncbi:MAG: kynureninase [Clostridia bacterium]|nr:kynureninase [Clostridia bacterium]
MTNRFEDSAAFAAALDAKDPLKGLRARFYCKPGVIYMDGNSLGLCSKDAEACVLHALEVWKNDAINIWSAEESKYFLYPSYLGAKVASLIGAEPCEVTLTNSTTVNIHQCLATFYKPTPARYKILVDDLNFPTDSYAVASQLRLHGLEPDTALKVVKSPDGRRIDEDALIAAMTEDVALALLPSALYRSAQLLDMARLTAAAHARGVLIGWDLCHSIGVVPHALDACAPDFAVWCNYKYLNGGPGTVAGLYINRRHFAIAPGLAGWQGNKKETQFQLRDTHEPSPDADGWLTGTPPILSMAALEGALRITEEAGMPAIREKSLQLTAYLMYLIDERLTKYGFQVGNPREDAARGGHVALEHDEAWRICRALKDRGVIPDFREPNVVRLAPAPLYTSFSDVRRLVDILEDIAANRLYAQYDAARALVV